mgnify:CR=1 FL=1
MDCPPASTELSTQSSLPSVSTRRGAGQERHKRLAHADRAGAGAAAAVRGRERLVQVHVHDVDPDMAHVGIAHDRVQVRTVAVDEAAAGVPVTSPDASLIV